MLPAAEICAIEEWFPGIGLSEARHRSQYEDQDRSKSHGEPPCSDYESTARFAAGDYSTRVNSRYIGQIQQISQEVLRLNQGTLYPALVRLEHKGWIKGVWQRTETHREAKYYTITKAGLRGLEQETARWRRLAGLVDKLLLDEG